MLLHTDGAQETEQTLGAGGKSLAVKTYTMMVANLSVTAQVTEAGCIPISETIIGYSAGSKSISTNHLDRQNYPQSGQQAYCLKWETYSSCTFFPKFNYYASKQ